MVLTKGSEHLGHFVKAMLSDKPGAICQIDGATGERETKRSVFSRTIRLSYCMRNYGLKPGDVIALGGRNHLDVHIPFYAAMMSGFPMAGVDPQYKYDELKALFKIIKPKIVFCEPDACEDAKKAALDLGLTPLIVTFKGGEYPMEKFMEEYYDHEPEELFEIPQIDTEKVYAWLVSTSGTTGTPKVAALKHPELLAVAKNPSTMCGGKEIDTKTSGCGLNMSSMQWITACFNALFIPVGLIKVQSSAPSTSEHVTKLIKKYKPKVMATTPTMIARVMHTGCDLTCFDILVLGGSQVHEQLLIELKICAFSLSLLQKKMKSKLLVHR